MRKEGAALASPTELCPWEGGGGCPRNVKENMRWGGDWTAVQEVM